MLDKIKILEKQMKKISEKINEIKKQQNNRVKLMTLKPGDKFMLCDREFIVLCHNTGTTDVICNELWFEDIKFGATNNYAESNIRSLCEDIASLIIEEVGEKNIRTRLLDLTAVDGGNDFGSIMCKVSPIPFMKMRKYFPLLKNENLNGWWWSCTPWNLGDLGYRNCVAVVSPSGYVNYGYCRLNRGVRPFCILKSGIFVEKCVKKL